MGSNQQLEWEYHRAESLANWSYIGIIIPIMGIIFAGISISKLRALMNVNENDETAYILESTHSKARIGMTVSIVFMVISTFGWLIIYSTMVSDTQNQLRDALNTTCTQKTTGDIYNMESTLRCQ